MRLLLVFSLVVLARVCWLLTNEEKKSWVEKHSGPNRTEYDWERGCSVDSQQVMPDMNVSTGGWYSPTPIFTFDGEMTCIKRNDFCVVVYYTLRNLEFGPICPFASFKRHVCASSNTIVHQHQFILNEGNGLMLNGNYKVGIEIYNDCDDLMENRKLTYHVGDFSRTNSCFYAKYDINLDDNGVTDYDMDVATRFLFFPETTKGSTLMWMHKNVTAFNRIIPYHSGKPDATWKDNEVTEITKTECSL